MKSLTAPIAEIFCSIQGEGLYCGQQQVFLRFAGCNLTCRYCDEPAAFETGAAVPMSCLAAAKAVICSAVKSRAAAVSLTGGEPLLHWRFIKAIVPAIRKAGLAVHLETNGTLCRELGEIKGMLDVIAADIKLPSSTGGEAQWAAHARFIAAVSEKTFIKVVLTDKTSLGDIKRAVALVAKIRRDIPFFLQPATSRPGGICPPGKAFIKQASLCAAARLSRVTVRPQQHPLWGIK